MRPIISAPPMQQMDTTPTEGITQKVRSLTDDCNLEVTGFGAAAACCVGGCTVAVCCFHQNALVGVVGAIVAAVGVFTGLGIYEFSK